MTHCANRLTRRFPAVVAGCVFVTICADPFAAELTITVDNVKENKGVVRVAVFEEANWLDKDTTKLAGGEAYDLTERSETGAVVVTFDLEPGEYGAMVYQDLNANRALDRNLIGMPKEPYAFSGGFDKLRRPEFEDCKFEVGEDGAAITLTLR